MQNESIGLLIRMFNLFVLSCRYCHKLMIRGAILAVLNMTVLCGSDAESSGKQSDDIMFWSVEYQSQRRSYELVSANRVVFGRIVDGIQGNGVSGIVFCEDYTKGEWWRIRECLNSVRDLEAPSNIDNEKSVDLDVGVFTVNISYKVGGVKRRVVRMPFNKDDILMSVFHLTNTEIKNVQDRHPEVPKP